MSTVPSDTLEFVKRLRDADVPVKQAEALRHVLAEQVKAQTETNTRAVEDLDNKTDKGTTTP